MQVRADDKKWLEPSQRSAAMHREREQAREEDDDDGARASAAALQRVLCTSHDHDEGSDET